MIHYVYGYVIMLMRMVPIRYGRQFSHAVGHHHDCSRRNIDGYCLQYIFQIFIVTMYYFDGYGRLHEDGSKKNQY